MVGKVVIQLVRTKDGRARFEQAGDKGSVSAVGEDRRKLEASGSRPPRFRKTGRKATRAAQDALDGDEITDLLKQCASSDVNPVQREYEFSREILKVLDRRTILQFDTSRAYSMLQNYSSEKELDETDDANESDGKPVQIYRCSDESSLRINGDNVIDQDTPCSNENNGGGTQTCSTVALNPDLIREGEIDTRKTNKNNMIDNDESMAGTTKTRKSESDMASLAADSSFDSSWSNDPSTFQVTTSISQSFRSFRSGSFRAHFSVMPNFYIIETDPFSSPSNIVRQCRLQHRLVQQKESVHLLMTNRKMLNERSQWRQLACDASIFSAMPKAKPSDSEADFTIYSTRIDDQAAQEKKRYSKALTGKKPKATRGVAFKPQELTASRLLERIIGRVPWLPTSSTWVFLKRAIACPDEPLLRYVCYFGDNDTEDVMGDVYDDENVITQGKNESQENVAALYEQDDVVIEQYLLTIGIDRALTEEELNLLEASLKRKGVPIDGGARGSKDTSEVDSGESFSARCQRLLNGLRFRVQMANLPELPKRDVSSEQGLMDTFRSLFCRLCFIYDCEIHQGGSPYGNIDSELWEIQKTWAVDNRAEAASEPCGPCCALSSTFVDTKSVNDSVQWLCAKTLVACRGSSCEAAKILTGIATCSEINSVRDLIEPDLSKKINHKALRLDTVATARLRADLHNSKTGAFQQSLRAMTTGETAKRLLRNKKEGVLANSAHSPCAHLGPCTSTNCSCVQAGNFCTKHCLCIVYPAVDDSASSWGKPSQTLLCKNLFPGCRCSASCEKYCPCHTSAFGCDADLCYSCASRRRVPTPPPVMASCSDVLAEDSANTTSPTEATASKKSLTMTMSVAQAMFKIVLDMEDVEEPIMCKNQVETTIHLLLAPSGVPGAGWGIFARNHIMQGVRVAEYLGEVISQEEAERRGRYYDKVNRSYLFNVNADDVVDAFRKGNKIKFANHSRRPNCEVRIVNCNRQQHIIIYAKRDIEPGEELFFDYHYEQELKSDYLKKNGVIVDWMRDGQRANSIRKHHIDSQVLPSKDDQADPAASSSQSMGIDVHRNPKRIKVSSE